MSIFEAQQLLKDLAERKRKEPDPMPEVENESKTNVMQMLRELFTPTQEKL